MEKENGAIVTVISGGVTAFAKEVRRAAGGGKALLFAGEEIAEEVSAALASEGFSVIRTDVTDDCLTDCSYLRAKAYPDCVKVTVGAGGAAQIEAAKAFGGKERIFLFPTDFSAFCAFSDEAFFGTKRNDILFHAPPCAVIADREKLFSSERKSMGIGFFLSRYLAVWDGAYEELILADQTPSEALSILRNAAEIIGEITEENAQEILWRAILYLEEEIREKRLFLRAASRETAFLLSRAEGGAYPEHSFASAYTLLSLYRFYLRAIPLERFIPPDRTDNIQKIFSLCRLESSLRRRPPLLFAEGAEERNRMTAEYRDDFLCAIDEATLPPDRLSRVFRRLRKKERGERKTPAALRLLAVVSLTGERVSGYPLIKHIKMTGAIEPFLSGL